MLVLQAFGGKRFSYMAMLFTLESCPLKVDMSCSSTLQVKSFETFSARMGIGWGGREAATGSVSWRIRLLWCHPPGFAGAGQLPCDEPHLCYQVASAAFVVPCPFCPLLRPVSYNSLSSEKTLQRYTCL